MIERNHLACVTEYNLGGYLYIGDIIAIDKNMRSHEVEIKVTKSDLNGEVAAIQAVMNGDEPAGNKHRKHYNYLKEFKIVNKFSFAVPDALVEYALNSIKDTPYGLIQLSEPRSYGVFKASSYKVVKILKRAKLLKKEPISEKEFKNITRRACRYNFTLMNNILGINLQ